MKMASTHTTISISNFRNMFDIIHASTSYHQRHIARKNIGQSTVLMNSLCYTIRDALVNDNE